MHGVFDGHQQMTSALSTSATELVPEPRQCMAISPHTPEQLFEIGDRFVAVDVAHDFRRLRMCSAVGVRAVFTAALAALRTGNTGEIRRVSVTEYWQRGVLTPIPSMPTVAVLRPPDRRRRHRRRSGPAAGPAPGRRHPNLRPHRAAAPARRRHPPHRINSPAKCPQSSRQRARQRRHQYAPNITDRPVVSPILACDLGAPVWSRKRGTAIERPVVPRLG